MGSFTVNTKTAAEWKAVQEWVISRGGSWSDGSKEVVQPTAGVRYGKNTIIHVDSNKTMVYADIEYARKSGWPVITFHMFAVNRGLLPSTTEVAYMGMIFEGEEVKIVEKFSEALIVAVDDLGRLREELKKLKEEEEVVKKKIQGFQLALGEYEGTEFKLSVTEAAGAELDNQKTLEFLGEEKFLKVVRVVKNQAEQFMSKEEMDTCSGEPTITRKLTTRRLKK